MQLSNRDHGTKVTIHDLFGNMPVRVRHRPTDDADLRTRGKEWAFLCQTVTGMILATGKPVTLTMKASDKEHVYRVATSSRGAMNSEQALSNDEQSSFSTALVRSTLIQGSSLDPACWSSWIKTSARTPSMIVRAVISIEPAPSKQLQFLALGRRFISAFHGHNVLYDVINQQFMNSSFAVREEEPGKRANNMWLTNKQLKGAGRGVDRWPMFFIRIDLDGQQIRSLDQSGQEFKKNQALSAIADILRTMIVGFLKEHHFRPRNRRETKVDSSSKKDRSSTDPADLSLEKWQNDSEQTKCKNNLTAQTVSRTKSTNSSSVLGDLSMEVRFPRAGNTGAFSESTSLSTRSRIKTSSVYDLQASSASQSQTLKAAPSYPTPACATPRSQVPNIASTISLVDRSIESTNRGTDTTQVEMSDVDGVVRWTHPVTRELLLLNARTGCAVKPSSPTRPATVNDAVFQAGKGRARHDTQQRLVRTSSGLAQPREGSWVSSFFENWENPVFQKSEELISRVSNESVEGDLHNNLGGGAGIAFDRSFKDSTLPLQSKLSKHSLRNAAVVSQVDSKFILVKTGAAFTDLVSEKPGCSLLVLVDQHAADERIKIEGLFSELCASASDESRAIRSPLGHKSSVETTTLQRPMFFELHVRENGLFRRHAAHFAKWGILYDLVSNHTGPSTIESQSICRLVILALPPVVAERCRVEPKVLIEMLRSEAWKLDEISSRNNLSPRKSQSSQRDAKESANWVQRINSCPQGLVDMLNSRSCRSAIMFNDELSLQQCEELIERLAECHFPFQCAHGRPTMVPLVDLGGPNTIGDGDRDTDSRSAKGLEFRTALETWL
ncbi:DNA mismatch repair protein [Thelotrema lepadinum]|nr:DNA mismatch repair protein [Thelotrema lepadinum]